MRLATKQEEFLPLLKQAQQEAEAAFGNGAVYIERYVQNPRHIEFQVGGGALFGAVLLPCWCLFRDPQKRRPSFPGSK
jgi:acetyl/propionyl-CoA carboxylase alpha subunit